MTYREIASEAVFTDPPRADWFKRTCYYYWQPTANTAPVVHLSHPKLVPTLLLDGQGYMCVNNLPKVVTRCASAGDRTRDLPIASRDSRALTIEPPRHTLAMKTAVEHDKLEGRRLTTQHRDVVFLEPARSVLAGCKRFAAIQWPMSSTQCPRRATVDTVSRVR